MEREQETEVGGFGYQSGKKILREAKAVVAQAGEKASEVTEELPRLMQRVCCRTAANVHGPFAFYDLM